MAGTDDEDVFKRFVPVDGGKSGSGGIAREDITGMRADNRSDILISGAFHAVFEVPGKIVREGFFTGGVKSSCSCRLTVSLPVLGIAFHYKKY